MGYVELIRELSALPLEKRIELFDFSDFLPARFGLIPCELHDVDSPSPRHASTFRSGDTLH